MIARHFTRFGVFMALSAACFAGLALAQPEGRTDDRPAVAPALDPSLLQRVQELEGARRTARQAGLKDPKAWEANRAQRASVHRQQLATLWGSVVDRIDGQARLRLHADRMARLNRMLDLAEQKGERPLSATIRADIAAELARHVRAMQQLKAEAGLP